jgi:two-component sensor histidine kinase
VLPLAMPLSGRDGTVGVLVTGLDLAWLQTRLRERGLTREGSLTIADRKGVILARDPLPERFVGTSIPDSYQRLVNAPTPGTEEVLSQDGTRRAIGYVPTTATDGALYISAGISLDEAFAPVDRATQWSIAVILMATAAAVVLAYLVGHRFIQAQVRQILTTIAAWRGGNDAARTGMDPRGGELEAVGAAFDSLANELAARQSAQRRAEAHRDLLMGELTHRIKNTLATVQAIAALTFRKAGLPASVRRDFEARLASLATAHDVLSAKSWESAGLLDLLQQSTRPYQQAERQRVRLSGPDLMIKSQAVLSLSMALNELCTNAAKYGALSAEQGTVDISWGVHGASDAARFTLSWIERSGPPVAPPAEEGFGSFLIKRVVAGELSGTAQLDFAVTGLTCTIEAPASAVVEGEVVHPLRQSA